MAEQIGHNVVINSESTSGSPLVDVAVTQTSAVAASGGNSNHVDSNISKPSTQFGETTTSDAGKPSAGDDAYAGRLELPNTQELAGGNNAVQGRTNEIHDDASQGEGVADDRSIADVSIDASANSDTDTSRADVQERKDASNHNRTNSVKKPATFSKVSVTRNFLAKTVSTPAGATAAKSGEKASTLSPAALPAAKPRLVAKSGTALQNVQRLRTGADGSGGPDASKVWNKNQPTRPPPPKQFTDEELKQQYGIHLASRLQSDEGGNESKWADIDEDEDDWAPEAVTWVDGTKSTLNIQDPDPAVLKPTANGDASKDMSGKPTAAPLTQAPPQPAVLQRPPPSTSPVGTASTPLPADAPPSAKPALTSMKRPDQHMKILRPGAAASMAKQNSAAAGSASSDKPSLKAKSSAPPTKSPWAPVPKVESVSPINPPVQQSPAVRTMMTQDARAYESSSTPPPAREIAADTFDRSWRENEKGNRELFNSANGRYEPAPENRRGNGRLEAPVRKPAVLQRSTPVSDSNELAQAQPGSQTEIGRSNRRESSVGQGSTPQDRQDVASKVSEIPGHGAEGIAEAPQSTVAAANLDQNSVWSKQMPPQNEASAEPSISMEDAVKMQEKVMREKRELAIKRRKEEEEQEAIAKQERLKAKLAALEGAGKSKKDREAEAAAAAAAAPAATSEAKTVDSIDARNTGVANVVLPKPPSVATADSTPAPPSVPKADTRSYDKNVTKQPLSNQKPSRNIPSERQFVNEKSYVGPDAPAEHAARSRPSPESSGRDLFNQSSPAFTSPPSFQQNPADRKAQTTFGLSPNLASESTFSPWPKALSSTSVWGTSGIGNGTFDSSNTFAPLSNLGSSSSLPPPPGMGLQTASRISPKTFPGEDRSAGMQHQPSSQGQAQTPHSSDSRKYASGMDSRGDIFANQSRLHVGSSAPGLGRPAHPPGPIGPPSRTQLKNEQNKPNSSLAQWHNLAKEMPSHLQGHSNEDIASNPQEMNGRAEGHVFRETFKKIAPALDGRLGVPRRFESTEFTVHDKEGLSRAPLAAQSNLQRPSHEPSVRHATPLAPWAPSGLNAIGLPAEQQDLNRRNVASQQPPIGPPPSSGAQPAVLPPHLRPKAKFPTTPIESVPAPHSLMPPPPETESHPVNTGDAHRPQVRLPPPQARVKLPPALGAAKALALAQSAPNMTVSRQLSNIGSPGSQRPIVQNADWQLRFNGLFGRAAVSTETPPSPPKTPPKSIDSALAVASSTRIFMDDHHNTAFCGATVSLPSPKRAATGASSALKYREPFTKPTSAHLFDEVRSFGSRPAVVIPRNTRYNLAPYSTSTKNPPTAMNPRMPRATAFAAQSKDIVPAWMYFKDPKGFHLRIQGTRLKNLLVPHQRMHDESAHWRRTQQDRPARHKTDKSRPTRPNPNPSAPAENARKANDNKKSFVPPPAPPADENAAATAAAAPKPPASSAAPTDKKPTWTKPARGGARRSSARPTPAAAAVSSS